MDGLRPRWAGGQWTSVLECLTRSTHLYVRMCVPLSPCTYRHTSTQPFLVRTYVAMTYETKRNFSFSLASYCAISIIDAESSCGLGRLPNILRLSNLEFTIISPMAQIPTIGCVIYLYTCMYLCACE